MPSCSLWDGLEGQNLTAALISSLPQVSVIGKAAKPLYPPTEEWGEDWVTPLSQSFQCCSAAVGAALLCLGNAVSKRSFGRRLSADHMNVLAAVLF